MGIRRWISGTLRPDKLETDSLSTADGFNSDIGDNVDYLDPRWITKSDAIIYNEEAWNAGAGRIFSSGSGGTNTNEYELVLETGTTDSSHVEIRDGVEDTAIGTSWDKPRSWAASANIEISTADRTDYYGSGLVAIGSEGIAFKVGNGDLLGAVNDGSSETTTPLLTDISAGAKRLRYESNGSSVEFFVDGTSEGTISSGLPTGGSEAERFLQARIDNSAAANKRSRLGNVRVVQLP